MREELLSCPFCGDTRIDTFFVRGASMVRFEGKVPAEIAVREAWNRRAPPPSGEEDLIGRLREAAEDICANAPADREFKDGAVSDLLTEALARISTLEGEVERAAKLIARAECCLPEPYTKLGAEFDDFIADNPIPQEGEER